MLGSLLGPRFGLLGLGGQQAPGMVPPVVAMEIQVLGIYGAIFLDRLLGPTGPGREQVLPKQSLVWAEQHHMLEEQLDVGH